MKIYFIVMKSYLFGNISISIIKKKDTINIFANYFELPPFCTFKFKVKHYFTYQGFRAHACTAGLPPTVGKLQQGPCGCGLSLVFMSKREKGHVKRSTESI